MGAAPSTWPKTRGADKGDLQEFVHNNIQHLTCKRYVRDSRSASDHCQCGRDLDWHQTRGIQQSQQDGEKWQPDTHTYTLPADTFGTMYFEEDAGNYVPYVRIDHKTSPELAWVLMSEYWGVPKPTLIISVTGGAQDFFMSNKHKLAFGRCLVKAAVTTGAWIVTGGTKAGVMEIVGDAVKEYSMTSLDNKEVVTLGITSWGIVNNKERLISEDGKGLFPAVYRKQKFSPKRSMACLDPNHTHFILVDDGTEYLFGKEINFRVSLEQYISDKVKVENQRDQVPVVILVVEGGPNTILNAVEGIRKGSVVVIIQGTGRAADLIAFAYHLTKSKDGNEDLSHIPESFNEEVATQTETLFDWSRVKDTDEKKQEIRKCVANIRELMDQKYRRLVTVSTLDSADKTKGIDYAILWGLLKAKKSDVQSQLSLALAWNCYDVARQEIFTTENRAEWQQMDLNEAMFTALVKNHSEFVRLFLDNGMDLKQFLTVRRLRDLYMKVVSNESSGTSAHLLKTIIAQFHTSKTKYNERLLYLVGCVIHQLMDDQQGNQYAGAKYNVLDEDTPPASVSSQKKTYTIHMTALNTQRDGVQNSVGETDFGRESADKKITDFDNPARELFLWAILLNRQSLALLFWRAGRDHIGGALLGSALLKSLASRAGHEEEIDLKTDLAKNAVHFEELAVGVLNMCYRRDKQLTYQGLVRKVQTCGNMTPMDLSDVAGEMDFMAHSACQTKLSHLWMGRMALYTSTLKILAAMILPFVLFLIKFKPANEIQMVPTIAKQHKGQNEKETDVKQLLSVSCCRGKPNQSLSFWKALMAFHVAPIVKFSYHTLSQVIYLVLFSLFVMTDLHPNSIGVIEIIVWGWTATLIVEEIRQVFVADPTSMRYKFVVYFRSIWNRFDLVVYLMFVISVILRCTLDDGFIWARMFYCVTLAMFYIRLMQVFLASRHLGPKLIMIQKMLVDLLFFVCILVVFILSYGVAAQALRYPNSPVSWTLIRDAVYLPYWQMYGELELDIVEGDVEGCSDNETELELDPDLEPCPEESSLVLILFAIYMIIVNVLLLNLLIAMFSYTFERVQKNSEKVWQFYRYDLVREYSDRPILAPPLIIFSHMWRIVKFIYRGCHNEEFNNFREKRTREEHDRLTVFERSNMNSYFFEKEQNRREDADVRRKGEKRKTSEENPKDLKHNFNV